MIDSPVKIPNDDFDIFWTSCHVIEEIERVSMFFQKNLLFAQWRVTMEGVLHHWSEVCSNHVWCIFRTKRGQKRRSWQRKMWISSQAGQWEQLGLDNMVVPDFANSKPSSTTLHHNTASDENNNNNNYSCSLGGQWRFWKLCVLQWICGDTEELDQNESERGPAGRDGVGGCLVEVRGRDRVSGSLHRVCKVQIRGAFLQTRLFLFRKLSLRVHCVPFLSDCFVSTNRSTSPRW